MAPELFYGGHWAGNFLPALNQLGHEVVESKVDLLPASEFMQVPGNFTPEESRERDRITEEIVAEVHREHRRKGIDLCLTYFYNSHFNPAGFAEIKKLGIPTVNFYCNSVYQFELVSDISRHVDFAWHAEKHARKFYENVGANPVWVQMAADPDVYKPTENAVRRQVACFVGMRYADRDRWMAALIRAQVPVVIYGVGWKQDESAQSRDRSTIVRARPVHPPGSLRSQLSLVSEHINRQGLVGGTVRSLRQLRHRRETRKLSPLFQPYALGFASGPLAHTFSSHEVILNFSNVWSDGRPGSELVPHVRLRDFEGPMSRSCYITGYSEELAEFYELGKEVETYRSAEELIEKTRYLLTHPADAEKMREAGYRRAREDHTWVRRFEQLFREIGVE